MSAEKSTYKGFLESCQSLVSDRFVGRVRELENISEILDYPRRGKAMPTIAITGTTGKGKSWFLVKIAQILAENRYPFISLDLDSPLLYSFPGGVLRIARNLEKRLSIKTPRFDRVYEIYARKYLGIIPRVKEPSGGLFRDIIRSIKGEPDEDIAVSNYLKKNYGDNWEQTLFAKPMFEHFKAMSYTLAEDIDAGFDKSKFPFLTLLFDNFDHPNTRFWHHWFRLFDNSSRLLAVVSSRHNIWRDKVIEIPLADFDDEEVRSALKRRGIEATHAIARIQGSTGGSPIGVSISASVAETISRNGDVIRANTFDIANGESALIDFSKKVWQRLREPEQYALSAVIRAEGVSMKLLSALFAQRADFVPSLIEVQQFVPFNPILEEDQPISLNKSAKNAFESLTLGIFLPTEIDLALQADRLQPYSLTQEDAERGTDISVEAMLLRTRLSAKVTPVETFSTALEECYRALDKGDIDLAESIFKSSTPSSRNKGLSAIHRVFGFSSMSLALNPKDMKEFLENMETSEQFEEGLRITEYARVMSSLGDRETALRELQDCVRMLSAAITDTGGSEPALWFARGKALLLASEILLDSTALKEALHEAEKAVESFLRAKDSGLDPAGFVSIECAKGRITIANIEKSSGKLKSAIAWLDRAREALQSASTMRTTALPDIPIMNAEIILMRSELQKQMGNGAEAERFLLNSLEELYGINKEYYNSSVKAFLLSGNIQLMLAGILMKTGTEESILEALGKADSFFAEYENKIGGGDPAGWMGRGKALLLKAELLLMEDADLAISNARMAQDFFKKAWDVVATDESALARIDSLLFIGELLAEANKPFAETFDLAERILSERFARSGNKISLIKRKIQLAKARGKSAFIAGDNKTAAGFFASAIQILGEMYNISSELTDLNDLAELHLATAVALKSEGEPIEAFRSLHRAKEAFEISAGKNMKENLKRILHSAIGVYNDLETTGEDDYAFEVSLMILELAGKVGGPEVMGIGHELLVYWEAQDIPQKDKRRLREIAAPLRELWGE